MCWAVETLLAPDLSCPRSGQTIWTVLGTSSVSGGTTEGVKGGKSLKNSGESYDRDDCGEVCWAVERLLAPDLSCVGAGQTIWTVLGTSSVTRGKIEGGQK